MENKDLLLIPPEIFERGNTWVEISTKGCWVGVEDLETGIEQKIALELNELLLLYIALSDALEGKV